MGRHVAQVHGSAPDIAGQDIANPMAMVLSAAMMCRYGLSLPQVVSTSHLRVCVVFLPPIFHCCCVSIEPLHTPIFQSHLSPFFIRQYTRCRPISVAGMLFLDNPPLTLPLQKLKQAKEGTWVGLTNEEDLASSQESFLLSSPPSLAAGRSQSSRDYGLHTCTQSLLLRRTEKEKSTIGFPFSLKRVFQTFTCAFHRSSLLTIPYPAPLAFQSKTPETDAIPLL